MSMYNVLCTFNRLELHRANPVSPQALCISGLCIFSLCIITISTVNAGKYECAWEFRGELIFLLCGRLHI